MAVISRVSPTAQCFHTSECAKAFAPRSSSIAKSTPGAFRRIRAPSTLPFHTVKIKGVSPVCTARMFGLAPRRMSDLRMVFHGFGAGLYNRRQCNVGLKVRACTSG